MGVYLRRAEDLGFECGGDRPPPDHAAAYSCTWLEPVAMLSALAGVTRDPLGTMVLVLPLRNPAYFAKEWATLDVLSGDGRSSASASAGTRRSSG